MADLSSYITLIDKARRGEDVRDAIINALHAIVEEGVNSSSLNGHPASDFILKTEYFSNIFFDNIPIKDSRKAVTSDGLYYCLIQTNYVLDDINGEEIEEYVDEGTPVEIIYIYGEKEIILDVNPSIQLITDILPVDATNKRVNWSSSNRLVATVNRLGNVQGISPGNVVITATARDGSNISKNHVMSVRNLVKVTGIVITTDRGDSPIIAANTSDTKAIAIISPENVDDQTVTWHSSNEDILTIESDGSIITKDVSEVHEIEIYCTANDGTEITSNVIAITVRGHIYIKSISMEIIEPESLDVNTYFYDDRIYHEIRVAYNKTVTVKTNITPENSDSSITWIASGDIRNIDQYTPNTENSTFTLITDWTEWYGEARITAKYIDENGVAHYETVLLKALR